MTFDHVYQHFIKHPQEKRRSLFAFGPHFVCIRILTNNKNSIKRVNVWIQLYDMIIIL